MRCLQWQPALPLPRQACSFNNLPLAHPLLHPPSKGDDPMLYMTNSLYIFKAEEAEEKIIVHKHHDNVIALLYGGVPSAPDGFTIRLPEPMASALAHEILNKLGGFHD